MKSQVISIDDQRLAQKKEKKLIVLSGLGCLATYIGCVPICANTLETKTN
jgi:hypothetical protein